MQSRHYPSNNYDWRVPDIVSLMMRWILNRKPVSTSASWNRYATRRLLSLLSCTVLLLVARLHIMGAKLPVFTRFDNPASVSGWPTRHLTYQYLIALNLWLLIFPCDLCCDWTMGTIPLVESVLDERNLATLCLYVFLCAVCYVAAFSSNRTHSVALIM
ncbi:transmembrane and TPR repeat-containing protein 3-like, partial [Diaphorina citri]|uniref:Transmembrane and TPR repeat-containing protein 3-like n=1 Tax=Diaphorina citri TaxID=121845 RepID=A0A1S3DK57_DIACI